MVVHGVMQVMVIGMKILVHISMVLHLWPLDFDFNTQTSCEGFQSENTHSGWAFADDDREMFISQNNRTDKT